MIQTRDVLAAALEGEPLDLNGLCRKAPVIPDLMDAMDALAVLRSADVPLALVHDEYGHFDGIVTPGSILAALAGTFAHDVEHGEEPPLVEREDGSWLVSGAASADLLADRLGVRLPDDRDYSTVAGFALSVLKHLPETGESFRHDGWSFEIVDMDGRKIDKLIASRPKRKRSADAEAAAGRARACRTSVRSRRCRRARDSRPARRSRSRAMRPLKAPSCASSRSISVGVRCASCSNRMKPSSCSASANLGPTPFMPAEIVGWILLARQARGAPERRSSSP